MPKILEHIKTIDSVILKTEQGDLKLQCCAKNILRIVYTLREEFLKKESLMVINPIIEKSHWSLSEEVDKLVMHLDAIDVVINKNTAALSYYDKDGKLLTKEPKEGGKNLKPVDVIKTIFSDDINVKIESGADGVKTRTANVSSVVDRTAYETKLQFCFQEGEAIYGLGSHEEGIMNQRGHYQYLYQHNLKKVIPFFVSTNGYGILIDSYSSMIFRDNMYGSYIWTEFSDEMDYYFIYGPQIDTVIKGYRNLTGKAPMLPKWAFGYLQSKERYKSQQELIDIVQEYRKRQIPLDGVVLDWLSWAGDLWGQKSFDAERFPDPKKMTDDLHKLNAKLMVSIWPNMSNDGPNRLEMKENGFLLGNQATYNAFNAEARKLYWKQANEGIFSNGTDAWWCDCSEPFEADWNNDKIKSEPETRLKINTQEFEKYLDPAYINVFSLFHSMGIYEGQRATTKNKRVVNLTRSCYGGQQRYSTITWSGDISANWETLKKQIASGLNFCISGCPYWSEDIGAFFVSNRDPWFWDGKYSKGCDDEGYRELYTRWFQYGTFLPMFRSHGTDTPREVWRFGEAGSMFYDSLLKFIKLRYRIIPYIYSMAWKVTKDDYTIMRALAFDFIEDKKAYDISDQYMFGNAFMVNPVTHPMYFEVDSQVLNDVHKTRKVYLPKGCSWYDFWTGTKLPGGQCITADAPIETIPLYVKSGSIVPMGNFIQHTGESSESDIELRIYPGEDGSFTLYSDEGDSYNYEQGCYSTIEIKWVDNDNKLVIEDREGSYDGMSEKITFKVVKVSFDHGNGIEYAKDIDKYIEYKGNKIIQII